jgi:hypothetical protein
MAKRSDYLVQLGVKAVRAEPGTLASIRFALGLETPEWMDVELLAPRAVLQLEEQGFAPQRQLARKSARVSAARRAQGCEREQKLLAPVTFESRELAEEQRPARRVQ